MKQISTLIRTFFEDFERASNTFEQELLASQMSDPFMAANPHGGIQIVKKDEFLAGIAKRQAFFHSIGFQFVKIAPLEETRLDTSYVMVKARAQMRFEKTPGQPVDLDSTSVFILFIKGDTPEIVFQLTHEDLLKIMQEHGLLPAKQ
jgi:hypothetical protein